MAGLKLFISQAMTGRKELEVHAERWFYHALTRLRFAYGDNENNKVTLINQYDTPFNMPTFEGNTTEERETKQSLWLLGRSIQLMRDADIIIMVGNPIESKGMMVEYEVLRQYKAKANWWFYTGQDMINWCRKHRTREFMNIWQAYSLYLSTGSLSTNNEKKKHYIVKVLHQELPDMETIADMVDCWLVNIHSQSVLAESTSGVIYTWAFKMNDDDEEICITLWNRDGKYIIFEGHDNPNPDEDEINIFLCDDSVILNTDALSSNFTHKLARNLFDYIISHISK